MSSGYGITCAVTDWAFKAALATVLLACAGVRAQTRTWDDGAAENGNWSSAANWTGDSGISSGNAAVFGNDGVGTSVMDKAAEFSISKLTYQNTNGTHTLDLNGNKLNISSGIDAGYEAQASTAIIQDGSMALAGWVRIGFCDTVAAAQNTVGSVTLNNVAVTTGNIADVYVGYSTHSTGTLLDSASGTWDMSGSHNGVFNNQGSGEFEVGGTRTGAHTPTPNTGVVRFGDNWDIDIGTAASPTEFRLGYSGNGTLTAGTGGSFTGYFNNFTFASQGNATLDLSGIDNGYMWFSAGGGQVGDGGGSSGRTATMNLGSNWTMQFNGGTFGFGYNGATTTVTAPNLTLTGTLTRLYVGTSPSGSGIGGQATVTAGGLGAGLTVGEFWVGSFYSTAVGSLTLPAGDFTVTGGTYLGSGGTGTVTLDGTRMRLTAATTSLRVGGGGRVNVNVGGLSCGPMVSYANRYALDISSTVTSGRGLKITFTQNPADPAGKGFERATVDNHDDIFFGLKWAGNRTATTDRELGWLIANGRIAWDDSALTGPFADAVGMFYDTATDATYIGCYVRTPKGTLISIR